MTRLRLAVLLFATFPLFGATLTWTGAVSSNWSEPGNWSPQAVPQDGDDLTFPEGAANKQLVHDLGDAFVVHDLRILGSWTSHYTLDGDALTLTGLLVTQGSSAFPFVSNVDVTIGSAEFRHASNDAVLNGSWNVNGYAWSGGQYNPSGIRLNGPLTGTGVVDWTGTISGGGDYSGTLRGTIEIDSILPNATFTYGVIRGTGYIGAIDFEGTWGFVSPGPGRSGVGTLYTGTLDLTGARMLEIDVTGIGEWDTVQADSVTIGGAPLQVSIPGVPPEPGAAFVIIENIGASPVNGTFAGLPEGTTFQDGGGEFTITYSGGDGNDVVLTASSARATHTTISTDPPFPGPIYSQPVTLIATVTAPGATVNTGTVTFYQQTYVRECCPLKAVGTVPVVNGVATLPMPPVQTLYAAMDFFSAQYDGGPGFAPSERSTSIFVDPELAPTTTTVTASTPAAVAGQPVTFTATPRAQPPAAKTVPEAGFVIFTVDGVWAAAKNVSAGEASFTTTLGEGTHTIAAEFRYIFGAVRQHYEGSSGTLTYTVAPAVAPVLLVAPMEVAEGDSGTRETLVTVQLSPAQSQSVTVEYRTEDGTARAGRDYVPASGTLTFAPGETTRTIRVVILGDGVPEYDRTFSVILTSPVNATIAAGTAPVRIVNDDVTFRSDTYAYANDLTLTVDTPLSGSGPFPAIVWIPGTTEYAPDGETPAVRETARGYVVVTPEYRPAGTAPFPAQLDDLQAAIRWLRANAERLNVEPNRIAAWGSGTGAHLAALLGTMGDRAAAGGNPAFAHRLQAVVAWSAPADLPLLQSDACSGATAGAAQQVLLGCPPSTCGADASPLTHVTSDDAPMLLVHGARDCTVAPAQSQRLHAALAAVGVPASLQIVDAGDTGDGWWSSEPAFTLTERFLDARLKGSRLKRRAVD